MTDQPKLHIIEHEEDAGGEPYLELRPKTRAGASGFLAHIRKPQSTDANVGFVEAWGDSYDRAFQEAVAYARGSGIAYVWINDPRGLFPPDKRPVPTKAKKALRREGQP